MSRLCPLLTASVLLACAPAARPAPRVALDESPPAPAPSVVRWRAPIEGGAAQLAIHQGGVIVATRAGTLERLQANGEAAGVPGDPIVDVTAIASLDDVLAVGTESGAVVAIQLAHGHQEPLAQLSGGAPVALTQGYGGSLFASVGGRVVRADGAGVHDLAGDLGPLGALVPNGGSLVAASGRGVVTVDLRDGAVAAREDGSPGARSVTLDHQGLAVASVVGRGLLRYPPEGAPVRLEVLGAGDLDGLAFDAETRTLFAIDRDDDGAVLAIDYLALLGEDPAVWAARDARVMGPLSVQHERATVALSGAEYWPNRGDAEADYPADILWGFYPEEGVVFEGAANVATATPAAVACAERSYAALREFIAAPPADFFDGLDAQTSSRFYLWINDYSEASETFPHEVRPARFWYWRRDPAVPGRIPGYWKWETTLDREGVCHIPDPGPALEAARALRDAPVSL